MASWQRGQLDGGVEGDCGGVGEGMSEMSEMSGISGMEDRGEVGKGSCAVVVGREDSGLEGGFEAGEGNSSEETSQ